MASLLSNFSVSENNTAGQTQAASLLRTGDIDSNLFFSRDAGVPSELHLKYADVLATLARLKETNQANMFIIQSLFLEASHLYNRAAQPGEYSIYNAVD